MVQPRVFQRKGSWAVEPPAPYRHWSTDLHEDKNSAPIMGLGMLLVAVLVVMMMRDKYTVFVDE